MPGPVSVEYGAELWPYDEAADQNPGGTIYDNRHTRFTEDQGRPRRRLSYALFGLGVGACWG